MNESNLAARVQEIEESATLAVDAKAKRLKAEGVHVIGFGAGEPDFPTPDHIVEAAREAAADPSTHNYSPTAGLPALREAIADKTRRESGWDVTGDQVLVTNGGKHALYDIFQTLVEPGDEVLLPAPYWVTYPEQIRLAGAKPVIIDSDVDSDFKVSVDRLEQATTGRTKALLFVSPSNPTGTVYTPDEVRAIGEWADERNIWVISDEIYQHLVYADAEFVSMPVVAPGMADRCIVVNGVAKSYSMTGWRVGWFIAPAFFVNAAARLQSHMTSNVANVAQRAALAALTGPQDCVEQFRQAFDRRRKLMIEGLNAIDVVECPEPKGAFYAFPDFSAFFGRELGGSSVDSSMDLAAALLEVARVAIVPGEPFGAPGCARLSYAMSDDDITDGLERIRSALS